jgi:hypothetical protein
MYYKRMNCDDIEWLVDILGTMDLLALVIEGLTGIKYPVKDVSVRGSQERRDYISKKSPDGLYFDSGHWYSLRNGITQDAYSEDYQKAGTAHFCQTFAVLLLTDNVAAMDLKKGQYAHNIRQAVQFWGVLFEKYHNVAEFILREIRTSHYANKDRNLKKIEDKDFTRFLFQVHGNADIFVGCKQG